MANDTTARHDSVLQGADAIWTACAELLGWSYSSAYGGYTHPNHFNLGTDGSQWRDYPSDVDAEEACDRSGDDTLDRAMEIIAEHAR